MKPETKETIGDIAIVAAIFIIAYISLILIGTL